MMAPPYSYSLGPAASVFPSADKSSIEILESSVLEVFAANDEVWWFSLVVAVGFGIPLEVEAKGPIVELAGFSLELSTPLPIAVLLTGDLIALAGLMVLAGAGILAPTEGFVAYLASKESFAMCFVGISVVFLYNGYAGAGGDLLFRAEPFERWEPSASCYLAGGYNVEPVVVDVR